MMHCRICSTPERMGVNVGGYFLCVPCHNAWHSGDDEECTRRQGLYLKSLPPDEAKTLARKLLNAWEAKP